LVIGCGLCAQNCPHGNIKLHPFEVMIDDPERAGRKKAASSRKLRRAICAHTERAELRVARVRMTAAHRVDPRTFFADMLGQGHSK